MLPNILAKYSGHRFPVFSFSLFPFSFFPFDTKIIRKVPIDISQILAKKIKTGIKI